MADARRLVELGMVPLLAREVAAQIDAGTGDRRRLVESTMVGRLAAEVASQITSKAGDKRRLVELGVVGRLAAELATQIQGGGGTPSLNTLSVTPNAATVGTAYTGSVSGRTVGSTLALSGAGAAALSINSSTGAITGTPTTAGPIDVVETLAGYSNSPRTSSGVVTVVAAPVTGLPLNAPYTVVGNSYDAQTGAIDVAQYTDMAMGARGLLTQGTAQGRGGDRISHANDRWAPARACSENGLVALMNIENDLADAAVTADAAGGDVVLARAQAFTTEMRKGNAKVVAFKQGNTTAALGTKAAAATRYNSQIASLVDAAIDDPNDYQNANDTSDNVHPNKAVSAARLGRARGAAMKLFYTTAGVFDAGGQIAGNFNANWNMGGTAPTLTNATSGATAVQATDVLRTLPGNVPCRKLTVSGSVTTDPTASGATGDIQLRFSTPHVAGTQTTGKSVAFLCYVEITNAAGGDPVGLATFAVQCGQTTCFGKQGTAGQGNWNGGAKYEGPLRPVRPKMIQVQSLPMNTDFILRGATGIVDFEIRIAYLNVYYTDEVQYFSGAPAIASAIFTSGRPALFALPTTTPTSGPLAVGGTLAIGTTLATILGGGLTRTYDAMRGGATDVGDMLPATAAAAAVPYTVQSADAPGLSMRTTGSNAGGSSFVDTALLAVA